MKPTSRKKVAEAEELLKEEESLQAKLNIIEDLETRRSGPVKILDELSKLIPAKKAYMVNLTQSDDKLTLKGVAMDNETIALFMAPAFEFGYL